ncbi:MAG TPA: DUF397 domain-containing protein [Actinophytocola sp.]|uniref:DUF397 domain-containing protein n=1 Tax=Actinophytocola sp. TaxID=1872138 RepID=UPI002E0A12EA|nr:DUF397 domain-containing protein [Actinophytocola sp.]
MNWRKSSFSSEGGANCVEVAWLPGAMAFRDSKNPGGPVLLVKRAARDGQRHGHHGEA